MSRYYLFGAGINAYAVIQFFGRQNIIAAIDNDEKNKVHKLKGFLLFH